MIQQANRTVVGVEGKGQKGKHRKGAQNFGRGLKPMFQKKKKLKGSLVVTKGQEKELKKPGKGGT